MKRINVIALSLAMCAPMMGAFTLDEIFQGKDEIGLLEARQYSYVFEYGVAQRVPNVKAKYIGSFGCTMERVAGSDNQVKINNIAANEYFPENHASFIFTLSDDGTKLVLGQDAVSPDDGRSKLQTMKINEGYNWYYGSYAEYALANQDLVLNITKNADGTYHLESDTYSVGLNLGGNNACDYHYSTESLEFDTYDANCVASETFEHWVLTDPNNSTTMVTDYTSTRTYPLSVDMNYGTKVCTIKNFANQGYLVDNNGKTAHLTGTINESAKTVTFKETTGYPQQMKYSQGYGWTLYSLNYTLHTWAEKVVSGKPDGTVTVGATATYDDSGEVHHNDAEEAWVTNDGHRRTWDGFTLTFEEPILFFMNEKGPYSPSGTYEKRFGSGFNGWAFGYRLPRATAVYKDMVIGRDVTVNVSLKLNDNGRSADIMGVAGEIVTTANADYVDHYELHVVPGDYTSINDANFTHDLELGHVDAKEIHDSFKGIHYDYEDEVKVQNIHRPVVTGRAAGDDAELRANDYSFVKEIPWSHLGDSFKKADCVTYFVKTVYKPEANLAPTFHSMVAVPTSTMTSIEDVEYNYAEGDVEYYNLQGMRVAAPEDGQIYIRRQGAKVEKIRY